MASISTLSNTDSFADTLARCAPGHFGTVESRRDSIAERLSSRRCPTKDGRPRVAGRIE